MKKWFVPVLLVTITVIAALNCSSGTDKDKTNNERTTAASANKKVTFVEFGSVKCIPCKMMQPILKDIETEYGSQVGVVFYDVWTDEGRPQGQQYGIRSIPTQVFLDKDGKEFFRHEGYFPKEEIVKVLKTQGVVK
jgi:thioredoxin 1